jgi:hypothetical protein
MPLENATRISELVPANPLGSDSVGQGDNHIRMLKQVLQNEELIKTFYVDDVAAMKLLSPSNNQFIQTRGYETSGDGVGLLYKTLPIPAVADGFGDHALANGKVASLQERHKAVNWGIKFDDATDNSANIAAFVANGSYFEWEEGTCRTSALIPIAQGTHHHFKNTTLRIASGGDKLLRANQTKDWALTGILRLQGSGDGSGEAVASGEILMDLVGARRWTIENLECIETTGIGYRSIADGILTERAESGSIVNLRAHRCQTAADMGAGTTNEFVAVSNINISENFYGLKTASGNISISTGSIVDNVAGITMSFGTNSNHGIISDVSINHNSAWNLQATDVVNGMFFDACNWYGDGGDLGKIHLINSQGIVLHGGVLSSKVINEAGTGEQKGKNKLLNMTIPDSSRAVLAGDDLKRLDSLGHTPLNDTVSLKGLLRVNFEDKEDADLDGAWTNVPGRNKLGFVLNPSTGRVELRGMVTGGVLGTNIFLALPEELRPPLPVTLTATANNAHCAIFVSNTTGNILHVSGSTIDVSLEGLSYALN